MEKVKKLLKSAAKVVTIGSLSMVLSCAENKIVHRPQIIVLPKSEIMAIGDEAAARVLSKYPVVKSGPEVKLVKEVFEKLLSALPEKYRSDYDWKVYVLKSPQVNAFALPNGNIFVYTGLLKFINNNPNELAAVLGHEMAHVILKHGAEKVQTAMLAQLGEQLILSKVSPFHRQLAAELYNLGVGVAILLPYSRRQEREADLLGLIIMLRAGYNPDGAIKLWKKMISQFQTKELPEWLSDHPASEERLRYIERAIEYLRANPQYIREFVVPKELL